MIVSPWVVGGHDAREGPGEETRTSGDDSWHGVGMGERLSWPSDDDPVTTPEAMVRVIDDDVVTYSVRDVMLRMREVLGAAGLEQVRYLADGGVLGPKLTNGSGCFFVAEHVEALLRRPRRRLADLSGVRSLDGLDGAVVLRQLPLARIENPADQRWFYGTHADLFDRVTGEARRALDESTGRYWRLSIGRRADIWQQIANRGFCPMIVTLGKWVVGGRNITGLSTAGQGQPYPGRAIFDLADPGEWITDLRHTWLDSGNGPAILWWSR